MVTLMKTSKTLRVLSSINKNNPNIYKILFIGIRILYYLKLLLDTTVLKVKYWKIFGKINFNKVCWVSPEKIQYFITNSLFFKWNKSNRIRNGDWDLTKKPFDDLLIYPSIKQRFLEGKNWEETDIYNLIPSKQPKGTKMWTFKNKEERDKYLSKTDFLFNEIKKKGYRLQKELFTLKERFNNLDWKPIFDEVVLAIDRNGNFIFVNRKHRLAIAKVLDIPKIPSIFLIRHYKWMEFRKNLIRFTKKSQGSKLRYPLTHPDLQDIPSKYGDSVFNLIKKNLTISQGTILIFGAGLGYFCSKFEDEGYECYALENNRKSLYFMNKLRIAETKHFKISSESFFNYKKNHKILFDVALAIDKFQKYLEKEETYLKLINLLRRLTVKEMFLGSYNLRKSQKRKYYKPYNSKEFVNFVIENSSLRKVEYLGKTKDRMFIYKFNS